MSINIFRTDECNFRGGWDRIGQRNKEEIVDGKALLPRPADDTVIVTRLRLEIAQKNRMGVEKCGVRDCGAVTVIRTVLHSALAGGPALP